MCRSVLHSVKRDPIAFSPFLSYTFLMKRSGKFPSSPLNLAQVLPCFCSDRIPQPPGSHLDNLLSFDIRSPLTTSRAREGKRLHEQNVWYQRLGEGVREMWGEVLEVALRTAFRALEKRAALMG